MAYAGYQFSLLEGIRLEEGPLLELTLDARRVVGSVKKRLFVQEKLSEPWKSKCITVYVDASNPASMLDQPLNEHSVAYIDIYTRPVERESFVFQIALRRSTALAHVLPWRGRDSNYI